MKKSKAIALVSVGLVAGLVLGSIGIASAATGTDSTAATCGVGIGMGRTIRDAGARLVDIVADLTGLTVDEVKEQRVAGESVEDRKSTRLNSSH